ncbi:glycosyltransferase family 2 protein [Aminobacter sp. Piv2-1]|uniref:glycosyltransferase family 2 protein n=1 Tax=Aminobacter sp. Piv2-1 TaxID=3031122 RepID=UPI0030A429FC
MNQDRLPISAYIVCRDEVDMIGPCIESLAICNDIVVVDSGSTDGTLDLLESYRQQGYPIRLFHNQWPGYARQKQYALDQAKEEWCLNLDADERLDAALANELKALVRAPRHVGAWRINFRIFLYGYGYTPESVRYGGSVRLMRRGRAKYNIEQLVHEGVIIDGEIKTSKKGHILHARSISIAEQIQKENQYSSLKAEQLFRSGNTPRIFRLFTSPIFYFIKIFFIRRYFLCGMTGFIHATIGSIYSFMTESKLYQIHYNSKLPKS